LLGLPIVVAALRLLLSSPSCPRGLSLFSQQDEMRRCKEGGSINRRNAAKNGDGIRLAISFLASFLVRYGVGEGGSGGQSGSSINGGKINLLHAAIEGIENGKFGFDCTRSKSRGRRSSARKLAMELLTAIGWDF